MKIYPKKTVVESKQTSFDHLTPLEKKTRQAALLLVFVGVFVFFVKILFL